LDLGVKCEVSLGFRVGLSQTSIFFLNGGLGWAVENLMLKNYYKINLLPLAQTGQPATGSG